MTQTLQCNICGTQNKLGLHFCTACGEKFLYRCPQCSTNVEPGVEYCSHCSARLNWGTATEQIIDSTHGQAELTNVKPREIKKNEVTGKMSPQQKGISPWLIALIVTVVLIITVFIIDKVIAL
jgi:hypothetical protein